LIGLSVVIDELPDNDELENDDFDEISSSRVNLSSSLSFKIFFVRTFNGNKKSCIYYIPLFEEEEEEEDARTNTTWDNTFSSSEAYISDDD